MTQSDVERESRWLKIGIPLRVLSFDLENPATGGFSEDALTLRVNHSGGSVTLRHPVTVGDFVRIINLVNHREADFRVVGIMRVTEDDADIWGVECLDLRDDFWGVECPLPHPNNYGPVVLQCRACSGRADHSLTFMELEVLGSAGMVVLNCDSCGKPTYWVDADPDRRPRDFSAVEAVARPPRVRESSRTEGKRVERRATKRSSLKFPALVRNQAGEQELSRTVDISKSGACLTLFMILEVGTTVKIICPYDSSSGGIEQTAEVRWRSTYYNPDFPRTYGFRFIR